jgi:hypothetical protein
MGNISLVGATSGGTTLVPQATGTYTVTLPAATGTLAITASPTFTGVTTESTITSPAATALTIQSAGTTAMTVDTSQKVCVGTTASIAGGANFNAYTPSTGGWAAWFSNGGNGSCIGISNGSGTSTYNAMVFYNNGTGSQVGSIGVSGSATSFNTSSDYRLKENVAPMTTGLATINALKPVTYDWISDNSQGEGFIAHELQEHIPLAVTGEKDAVDDEGKPIYQGVDYSKIVVYLVAAIQELSAKNDALETRLSQLEAK